MEEYKELIGKVISKVIAKENRLIFTFEDGSWCKFYHKQECCECVLIDDICGDLEDLIGSPLIIAECNTNEGNTDKLSYTWTFYKFATQRGYVDVKWYGTSNGYYSEKVNYKYYANDFYRYEC